MMSHNTVWIWALPYSPRKQICEILDDNKKWKDVAEKHDFNYDDIRALERRESPTELLLLKMGELLITVSDLHSSLRETRQARCCQILENALPDLFGRLVIRENAPIESINSTADTCGNYNNIKPVQESILIPSPSSVPSGKSPKVSLSQESFLNISSDTSNGTEKIANDTHFHYSRSGGSEDPVLSFTKLEQITGNFSEKHVLADGTFGRIYKAFHLGRHYIIKDVKKTVMSAARGPDHFEKQIEVWRKFYHPNIVLLLDHCLYNDIIYLKLEYMERGNLRSCLDTKEPVLTCFQRHSILWNVSNALLYLHEYDENRPLIHANLKSTNILIDKNFVAKLTDFELSCEIDKRLVSQFIVENAGQRAFYDIAYMPLEFMTNGLLSTSSDIFSFGVIALEVLTGRFAKSKNTLLRNYIINISEDDIGDEKAQNVVWFDNLWNEVMQLAKKCLSNKEKRPTALKIEEDFRKIVLTIENSNDQNLIQSNSVFKNNFLNCENFITLTESNPTSNSVDIQLRSNINFSDNFNINSRETKIQEPKKLELFDDI